MPVQKSIPLMEINHISVAYQDNRSILNDIHLTINQGEFVSIIGKSGCGKSTLLNVIAGYIKPKHGKITVQGKEVTKPGPDRGFVFQDLALFPWLSVLDNVSFGLRMAGVSKQEIRERSKEAIQMVGLSGSEHKSISDLSGGMKQRVAIARTLVTKPNILLMDEPFSALDEQTRESLQEELLRIQKETDMTVILVTHSIDEAIYLSDRVAVFDDRGSIHNMIHIGLGKPRIPEIRVSSYFNEYKKQLMQDLRYDFQIQYESEGSGI
ncbi:nitrate ABC transporter ATP-binding protein [Paenibacillus sp. J23TS9]|uniref:ABC transporter ATP-binding protein n=1 Tax=Paenibacillus sp. J23TS9 TaxID=2807193 RepID=UPI001B07269C|nr:ABC transporter ATP-binding protein [Paenibacillus sp. J23TS9]GIP27785.1 nitrate ABC transporter ATP-binding protein [Paenibacillus sp. J23TS9]